MALPRMSSMISARNTFYNQNSNSINSNEENNIGCSCQSNISSTDSSNIIDNIFKRNEYVIPSSTWTTEQIIGIKTRNHQQTEVEVAAGWLERVKK